MKLQAWTQDDLYTLGVSIVREVTGVEYPFSERTFHRALVTVQAAFGASANIETLRMIKGNTLEGFSGILLDRRLLQEGNIVRGVPLAARLAGRFIPVTPPASAVSVPPGTIVIRAATATQTEIAFRLDSTATIPAGGSQSNLVYLTCTVTGTRGNAIPSGAQLPLKNPATGVSHFLAVANAEGGVEREEDPGFRQRGRTARRGHGEATWAGIENLLTTVELSTGNRVSLARVFEAFDEPAPFYRGIVYAIIDDGTGDDAIIGPEDTAYAFGGTDWWTFIGTGYHVYVQLPYAPLKLWDDGVNAALERDDGAGWVAQTLGTDYWVDDDRAMVALASPLEAGEKVRAQFTSYGGLVREAQAGVNGVVGSETQRGWRPTGFSVRVRPPYSVVTPTVSGVLVFKTGWDSTFGRQMAATNVLAYMNGVAIGASVRYDVINGILHKTPGLDYVDSLLLAGGAVDVAPTHKYGVVRGLAANITL